MLTQTPSSATVDVSVCNSLAANHVAPKTMESMARKDLRDGISRPRKSVSMNETNMGLHARNNITVSTFVMVSDRIVKLMPSTNRMEYNA